MSGLARDLRVSKASDIFLSAGEHVRALVRGELRSRRETRRFCGVKNRDQASSPSPRPSTAHLYFSS
jgi:hypothetical protein